MRPDRDCPKFFELDRRLFLFLLDLLRGEVKGEAGEESLVFLGVEGGSAA
jgi:hypothetical protein